MEWFSQGTLLRLIHDPPHPIDHVVSDNIPIAETLFIRNDLWNYWKMRQGCEGVHTTLVTFSYLAISDWIHRNGYTHLLVGGNDEIARIFLKWLELPIKANVQGCLMLQVPQYWIRSRAEHLCCFVCTCQGITTLPKAAVTSDTLTVACQKFMCCVSTIINLENTSQWTLFKNWSQVTKLQTNGWVWEYELFFSNIFWGYLISIVKIYKDEA